MDYIIQPYDYYSAPRARTATAGIETKHWRMYDIDYDAPTDTYICKDVFVYFKQGITGYFPEVLLPATKPANLEIWAANYECIYNAQGRETNVIITIEGERIEIPPERELLIASYKPPEPGGKLYFLNYIINNPYDSGGYSFSRTEIPSRLYLLKTVLHPGWVDFYFDALIAETKLKVKFTLYPDMAEEGFLIGEKIIETTSLFGEWRRAKLSTAGLTLDFFRTTWAEGQGFPNDWRKYVIHGLDVRMEIEYEIITGAHPYHVCVDWQKYTTLTI